MVKKKYFANLLLFFIIVTTAVFATQEQLRIELKEYVDQEVLYSPLKNGAGTGTWHDSGENQSNYNLSGEIIITNMNPNGKTISDIYVSFQYTTNITLPTNSQGRTGTFISDNLSTNFIILHIPELSSGENSTWSYDVNDVNLKPPLNFTSIYSDFKLLAGDNISITDKLHNVYINRTPDNTCIYDINITQVTTPIDFLGSPQDYIFLPITTGGADSSNVTYSANNHTQYWNALNGNCLNKGGKTNINYTITTPFNIPQTTYFRMLNTTIRYKLNNTMSHLKVIDITAISEANLDFEKRIMQPSHPLLYGSNVTWNVTGYFNTDTNISYLLNKVTMWVAIRNGGVMGDPNTIDNDTISNASLTVTYNPATIVNKTLQWRSPFWLFNYSDLPSPIVWMDVNYTINNDGTQLINRSIIQNGNDIYIKEIYLIIGYWLEINKNITALANDEYNIDIYVHNKGNQVTPAGTIVTIYDYVPGNFNVSSNFSYQISPWYTTTHANYSITGVYNGTLHQWGLIPADPGKNTSFAQGPSANINTTWRVNYNVTGLGDYTLLDVFVTGLDPQRVDGAGSANAVIVNEVIDRIKSTEGIFAVVASVLLLLGLLL